MNQFKSWALTLTAAAVLAGCGSTTDTSLSQDAAKTAASQIVVKGTPADNFDLLDWTLSVPIDENNDGKSDNIKEKDLAGGYSNAPYFYASEDGGMVFRSYVKGPKTSKNTTYTRSELREMNRRGDTSIKTKGTNKNNWVFSSAPISEQQKAAGVDGEMSATLAVNHVTETGVNYQVGRVVIGQIHATHDEPIRLYYRKLPGNDKGSIYFAHEPRKGYGEEQYYSLIGSKSNSLSNPEDGIALNEKFSYTIKVVGNALTVTLSRPNKEDIVKTIDMTGSGYNEAGQWMFFKAGVYNLNKSGDADDYTQATFYSIKKSHGSVVTQ